LAGLGIEDDAALVSELQGKGVAERFVRTLREQSLWRRLADGIGDLRQPVSPSPEIYRTEWLLELRVTAHARNVHRGDSTGDSVIVRQSVQRIGAATHRGGRERYPTDLDPLLL
jgi:hypothetical protein